MVQITPFDQVPQLPLVARSGFDAAGATARRQKAPHQLGVAPDRCTSFGSVKQAAYVGERIGAIHASEDRRHLT